MAHHAQLDKRAARLRALRYCCAHCSVLAAPFHVTIRNAPNGEGEIDAHGEPGETTEAREHFEVTEEPVEQYGLRTWTHHVGREGHGLILTFTEPIRSAS